MSLCDGSRYSYSCSSDFSRTAPPLPAAQSTVAAVAIAAAVAAAAPAIATVAVVVFDVVLFSIATVADFVYPAVYPAV